MSGKGDWCEHSLIGESQGNPKEKIHLVKLFCDVRDGECRGGYPRSKCHAGGKLPSFRREVSLPILFLLILRCAAVPRPLEWRADAVLLP